MNVSLEKMKSPIVEAGYEMAKILFKGGVIDDREMREFDALYLAAPSEKLAAPSEKLAAPSEKADYEMAKGLFKVGVMDAKEMRKFDAMYLAAPSEKATSKKK